MAKSNLDWLSDHMRDHMATATVDTSTHNILPFERPSLPANKLAAAAIDHNAVERQAHLEALVAQAIEKLKIASDRVQSAESAQRTAEAEKDEFSAKVQGLEEALEQAGCSMAAVEAKLSIALQQADAAERRALKAENALKYIEKALDRMILNQRLINLSSKSSVKAA